MTALLTHPPAEDLGRFVEGTLDDAGRTAVVAHIADCDECRIGVVDAAEFIEPVVVHSERRWWVAAAAVVVVAAGIGVFVWHQQDPVTDLVTATAGVKPRPVEAKLSGFRYQTWSAPRGGGSETDQEKDPETMRMELEAGVVLEQEARDAKMLHAHGVAHLLVHERKRAVEELTTAVLKKPSEARYWSDLAAAQVETGNLAKALEATDRALAIDPKLTDALFNRAVVLRRAERRDDAIKAYTAYLHIDATSKWADEARERIDSLRQHQ